MNISTKNLVEYHDMKNAADIPDDIHTFKQIAFDSYIEIPCKNPEIEIIVNVRIDPRVISARLIRSPVGSSLEGKHLTGYKVVVIGELREFIEYTAADSDQSLRAAHYRIPFSTFIVVPADFAVKSHFAPTVFIDHVDTQRLDSRTIYQNINLLITVEK